MRGVSQRNPLHFQDHEFCHHGHPVGHKIAHQKHICRLWFAIRATIFSEVKNALGTTTTTVLHLPLDENCTRWSPTLHFIFCQTSFYSLRSTEADAMHVKQT